MDIENVVELEVEVDKTGPQGYSAYEVYVQNGGTLTETQWLASLKGETGQTGATGPAGYTPIKGVDYTDGANAMINGYNTIEMLGGSNIELSQIGNQLTISSTTQVTPETTNLDLNPLMGEQATTGYTGSNLSSTSSYLYNQFAVLVPKIAQKINGIFDIAKNIKYNTVNTYAELQAIDKSQLTNGVYIYLVKQDENYPRTDTPAEDDYYSTIYIYMSGSTDFEFIGKLNVSEQMMEELITSAITTALGNYYTKYEIDVMIPTVPTNISSFTNDSGYITNSAIPTQISAFTNDSSYATTSQLFSKDYNDLINKPEIPVVPTNISSFNNDVNYATETYVNNLIGNVNNELASIVGEVE